MEISIIEKKKLVSDKRLDAEAYLPVYLDIERKINAYPSTTLGREADTFSKGIFDVKASEYLEEDGIPFVRIGNLKDMLISEVNLVHISDIVNEENKKTYLQKGDVILSKTAYPACSFVNIEHCNTSQDTIAVKLKTGASVSSPFLVAFLNSHYGFSQMRRWFTGNVQTHLNLGDSKGIKVPILKDSFQNEIKNLFEEAIEYKRASELRHEEAELSLLEELGLANWKPYHELTFTKKYSDTGKAERFDAEYFQPKYEEIVSAIKKYKNGWDTIGGQFKQNEDTFEKVPGKGYQYVEISCLNVSNGDLTPLHLQASELPTNAKIKLEKGDVLVSKVRPYRGAIGIVESDDYVGSGAFTALQENGIIQKEVLYVFLSSKPMLDFSLKFNTGTSYPVITDDDILNFPVPKLTEGLQTQIKEKIDSMHKARRYSKNLLDVAKRGVEIAIEKDEKTAQKWIDEQLKNWERYDL